MKKIQQLTEEIIDVEMTKEEVEFLLNLIQDLAMINSFDHQMETFEKMQVILKDLKEIVGKKDNQFSFEDFLKYIRENVGYYCKNEYWRWTYDSIEDKSIENIKKMTPYLAINAIATDNTYRNL